VYFFDGKETFDAIFEALKATNCIQCYIYILTKDNKLNCTNFLEKITEVWGPSWVVDSGMEAFRFKDQLIRGLKIGVPGISINAYAFW